MTFQIIYPKEIIAKQKTEHARVIDMRTRGEYLSGHWPGAVSYPYEDSIYWERRLPANRTLILYCEHGGTSMQEARRLGLRGYQVYSVVGGYEAMKKIQENYFKNWDSV